MSSLLTTFLALLFIASPISSLCPHEATDLKPWSDPASWEDGQVPGSRAEVVITTPILLDTETADLESLEIRDNGRLVFSPSEDLVKLTSDYVLIGSEGYLDIGSADCRFDGKAEILLTGKMHDDEDSQVPEFGQKFIGVMANGSLEIHGEDRLSWTKLTQSAGPTPKVFSNLNNAPPKLGVTVYEFNPSDGSLVEEYTFPSRAVALRRVVAPAIADNAILVVANNPDNRFIFKKTKHFDNFFNNFDALLGTTEGFVNLRESWSNNQDKWVTIINKATGDVLLSVDNYEEGTPTTETELLELEANALVYKAKNMFKGQRSQIFTEVMDAAIARLGLETIQVEDDASSWRKGDSVVIASTDYDWRQAEILEVESVEGKTIKLKGELNYMHYGEVYEGVDMRAEVGLLTRNVWIHGDMKKKCTDGEDDPLVDANDCKDDPQDRFGGHTKALRGFKAYNIEGAELSQMGQAGILGRYPIHFHMAHDTDEVTNPIVRGNAIHHNFQRCVTIHGSHGVHVIDNVAYDTIGHCFFQEDGGEKRTVFDRNLGMGTRKGSVTASDKQSSTFWIASPLTVMTNNVAAGSAIGCSGIWYIFPNDPVGLSTGLGFIHKPRRHAITLFENNVAHSNGRHGLILLKRLTTGHGIGQCSTYDPPTPSIFYNYTGYKNRETNALFRATRVEVYGFRSADARLGCVFSRAMNWGHQVLKDAVFIGNSPNLGAGGPVEVFEEGRWQWKWSDRSYPIRRMENSTRLFQGLRYDAAGSANMKDVIFKDFGPTDEMKKEQCNIVFNPNYIRLMQPYSTVRGLSFEDGAQRICGHSHNKAQRPPVFRDIDGTLTGTAGSTVINADPDIVSPSCPVNTDWDLAVCPPELSIQKLQVDPKLKSGWGRPKGNVSTILVRGSDGLSITGPTSKQAFSYVGHFASDNYILHWLNDVPKTPVITPTSVTTGDSVRIGVCLPLGVAAVESEMPGSYFSFVGGEIEAVMATSLEDLDNLETPGNVFYDSSSGVVYARITETRDRGEEDWRPCPGGCIGFRINLNPLGDAIDALDGDCTQRM